MLFPFNRDDQEVRIKLIDAYGTPVKSKYITGYIDLELIVDNTSSYSINA
jgi:hypothetical protein